MKKNFLAGILVISMLLAVMPTGGLVFAEVQPAADIRLVADGINQGAVLSWRNPQSEDITAIDVVDKDGDSVVPAGTVLKTGASESNGVTLTGLANDTLYEYIVKITVGEESFEYPTVVIPRNFTDSYTTDGYNLSPWRHAYTVGYATYIDNNVKYKGDSSLKITGSQIGNFFNIWQDKWYGNDVYEISFMAKAENVTGIAQAMNRWYDPRVTISGNEWKRYTFYSNTGTEKNPNPRIIVDGSCDAVWIDDVVVKKFVDGAVTGDNLDPNGSFEFGIINPMAGAKESGKLVLSWINPKNDYISDINIKDEAGNVIADKSQFRLDNRALNQFAVTGLTDGVVYTYDLEMTMNGVTTTLPIKGMPMNNTMEYMTQNGYTFSNWKLTGGANLINRYLDLNEAYEGKSSLKIVSNYNAVSYARMVREIGGLDSAKTYQVSFWAKLDNNAAANASFQAGTKTIRYTDDWAAIAGITGSNQGWKKYTYSFSGKTKFFFSIIFETQGVLWLDSVALYEMAEGVPVGSNLISDGGFEVNSQISHEMAVNRSGSVSISWQNPVQGLIKGIDILDENGEKLTLENEPELTAGAYTQALISGLQMNKEYNYTILIDMANGQPISKKITFVPMGDYNYTTQNGIKMLDLSKIKVEGGLKSIGVYINPEAKKNGEYGLMIKSNTKTMTSILFDAIQIDSTKNYRASTWIKVADKSGNVWLSNDWGARTQVTDTEWKKYTIDVSSAGTFIFRLGSEATYTALYADDFALYELDEQGNEIGENLMTNGGFENVYGVGEVSFTPTGAKINATVPAFNFIQNKTLTPTVILASYDGDGKMVSVDYQKLNVAVSEKKNAALSVDYQSGYSVKALVWNGETMIPLKGISEF